MEKKCDYCGITEEEAEKEGIAFYECEGHKENYYVCSECAYEIEASKETIKTENWLRYHDLM